MHALLIWFPFREELVLGQCDDEIKQKILNYADDSGDEKIIEVVTKKVIEFDCESILSKSIMYNIKNYLCYNSLSLYIYFLIQFKCFK